MHIQYGTYVDLEKSKNFWEVFADRYKNRTHVAYELLNEPDINSVKAIMADLFKFVRSKAPSTHLILWSLNDPEKISADGIWSHSNGIDYSNASVGWHSYETILGKTLRWDLAEEYKNSGLPVINTEFYSLDQADHYPIDYEYLVDNIRMGEERGMSWMQWAPVFNFGSSNTALSHNDLKFSSNYKRRVEEGFNSVPGIGSYWSKDSGTDVNYGEFSNSTVPAKSRLKDAWKGRYLHATSLSDYATTESAPLHSGWSSQKWHFEKVSGNHYRIKNMWTGTYLSASSTNAWDPVLTAELRSSWTSQQWAVESSQGGTYRIKNLWSGLYLHTSERAWDSMLQAPLNEGWSSQQYLLEGF